MFSIGSIKLREKKTFFNYLIDQFGLNLNFEKFESIFDYNCFINKDNRVYILNSEKSKFILYDIMKISQIGLYFCEYKNSKIRFSFEGSQLFYNLFSNKITKNVLELNDLLIRDWIKGNDILVLENNLDIKNIDSYCIIKNGSDIYGCGIIKDNKILNFVSKSRQLKDIYE